MFTRENHLWFIASLIISFISANLDVSAILAKLHHECLASSIGLNGADVLPSGVVLVCAQIGVVGDAWPVVSA